MNKNEKNLDPIGKEDLYKYLSYVLTKEVKDENHAKELRRLSRRVVTLSDVAAVVYTLKKQDDNYISKLMEAVQVQQKVMEKMGATAEMFKEAQLEYLDHLKDIEEQMKEAKKNKEGEKQDE